MPLIFFISFNLTEGGDLSIRKSAISVDIFLYRFYIYLQAKFIYDVNFSVIPSITNFDMINLQRQWQIYLLLENWIKNCWINLYLRSNSFKSTFKPNSCLISISRCGLVNSSTHTFANINLIKTMANLLGMRLEKDIITARKMTVIISISNLIPLIWVKIIFLSDLTFPLWRGKFLAWWTIFLYKQIDVWSTYKDTMGKSTWILSI